MLQNALKVGLIALAVGLGVQNADAFWGCGRGGCGWGGCGWGGCYTGACCGYGYAGCGYGGYAYAGCAYGAYGIGAGYGYGYGGVPGTIYPVAPKPGATPAAPANPSTSALPNAKSVLLTVNVPADAKVYINDHLTNSTGPLREYTSNNLQANESYGFRVRAEFVRDGKPAVEEQVVQLTAGQTGAFIFSGAIGAAMANVSLSSPR